MSNGSGRNSEMVEGAIRVREPQFRTQQQGAGSYRRTSILDNLTPTGNGMSGLDKQRVTMGITRSSIGLSENTFEKGLWLRSERSPSLYNTFG